MTRDPRYDILFEPVRIGPVVARNRFYQVPHCNGMGRGHPRALAAMRGMKAAGGWAVVATEECEIHPSSDISPYYEARLWDDGDIPALALMADAVHREGALAAIELTHSGASVANRYSRMAPLGPSHGVHPSLDPVQARGMDLTDIRDLRRWYRDAALRSTKAGFDIVYVYAGHGITILMHFLQRRRNQRTDAYGGSLENRARLFREVIEDTKDAIGARAAVAVRFAVDELIGESGLELAEAKDVVAMLAELPDLWDVNVSDWKNDSTTSRFAPEASQESFIAWVKSVTTKPVVGVGRFTSPDSMASQVRRGVLDFIGAARPSIADPFLPRKIEQGRVEDIRECIGCNVCVSYDFQGVPMRCTQNPTMGEEWRRGWHPEVIAPKGSGSKVLVVGAGPAGLEAARALGQRGYEVHLAEAGTELGGRVARECRLPGLAEWARVRDWRVAQIAKLPSVSVYRGSRMGAADVREFGAGHVAIATGARWRRDGVGRHHAFAVPGFDHAGILTPDDIMDGRLPESPTIVFDDDHYYLGGVIAERLVAAGLAVTLVTPAPLVSKWTEFTLEQERIQRRLIELGVVVRVSRAVAAFHGDRVETACVFTGARDELPCAAVVTVTSRLPDEALYRELVAGPEALKAAGIRSVRVIGDAEVPGTIAAAVHAGHGYARALDGPAEPEVPFRRERAAL
ncbi:MAG: FAD-dependent oxidoreductase [Alphaproteobacteria bacterium]